MSEPIRVQATVLRPFIFRGKRYSVGQIVDPSCWEPMERIGLDRQGKIRLQMSPPNFKPNALSVRGPQSKSWNYRELAQHRRG